MLNSRHRRCDLCGPVFHPRCAIAQRGKAQTQNACADSRVDDLVQATLLEIARGTDIVRVRNVIASIIDSAKTPVFAWHWLRLQAAHRPRRVHDLEDIVLVGVLAGILVGVSIGHLWFLFELNFLEPR